MMHHTETLGFGVVLNRDSSIHVGSMSRRNLCQRTSSTYLSLRSYCWNKRGTSFSYPRLNLVDSIMIQ